MNKNKLYEFFGVENEKELDKYIKNNKDDERVLELTRIYNEYIKEKNELNTNKRKV